MKVYIASPYTIGNKEMNVNRQIAAAEGLIKLGHVPYVPLLTHYWDLVSPHPCDYWLSYDYNWLELCDAVLRLSGESLGADCEVAHATVLGIPVYYSINDFIGIT